MDQTSRPWTMIHMAWDSEISCPKASSLLSVPAEASSLDLSSQEWMANT